jgi:hypothetical protein
MTETNGTSRRLAVYAVPDTKDGEKGYWTKIGIAFTNRDGSINLFLDALPLGTNKLQVREPKAPAERGTNSGGAHRDFDTVEVRP